MHTLACCWFYSITPRSLYGVGEYYSFRMLYIQVLLLHNNQPHTYLLISLSSFPSARPPVVSPVCVCTCAQPFVQCAASNHFFISRSIFLLLYLSSSNFLCLFHEVFFLLYILSSSKKNTYFRVAIPEPCIWMLGTNRLMGTTIPACQHRFPSAQRS